VFDENGPPSALNARTFIIDDHVVWGGNRVTVRVNEDILVTSRGTLEIRAGTTIEIVAGSVLEQSGEGGEYFRTPRFTVEGQFLSLGRQDAVIEFRVVEGEQEDPGYYDIRIQEATDRIPASDIRWTRLEHVQWTGGDVSIQFSSIGEVSLTNPDDVFLSSNILRTVNIIGGEGMVKDNLIREGLTLHDNTIRVEENAFSGGFRCILTGFGAHNVITRNAFERCDTAIEIFEGIPEITENNFSNNEVLLAVRPNASRPDNLTTNATHNWWGTTDLDQIRSRIKYLPNGSNTSQREILLEPIATAPYTLE
jgi:hypothetical protein